MMNERLRAFYSSFVIPHSSLNLHRPPAVVGAREARGQDYRGDHARMLRDAAARDVEGRAVVDRRAYERDPQRHVDRLAEREALDRDHRLVMVARNDRVE